MGNIWAFGSSYTYGDGCVPHRGIRDGDLKYYNEYKNNDDDIWPILLSNMCGYNLINKSVSGSSNDKIIDTMIDSWDEIKSDDIVIVQKTYSSRFDIPNEKTNTFDTIYGESLSCLNEDLWADKYKINKEDKETILNYGVFFASHSLFEIRHTKRFNFLKKNLSEKIKKCVIWDVNDFFLNGINRITTHTEGKIKDGHFSFIGHKQFSDIMYKKIFNNDLI